MGIRALDASHAPIIVIVIAVIACLAQFRLIDTVSAGIDNFAEGSLPFSIHGAVPPVVNFAVGAAIVRPLWPGVTLFSVERLFEPVAADLVALRFHHQDVRALPAGGNSALSAAIEVVVVAVIAVLPVLGLELAVSALLNHIYHALVVTRICVHIIPVVTILSCFRNSVPTVGYSLAEGKRPRLISITSPAMGHFTFHTSIIASDRPIITLFVHGVKKSISTISFNTAMG